LLVAAIRDSVERGFETFFEWLPQLVGALVILVLGYIVAKVVARAISGLLARTNLDRTLTTGQGGRYVSQVTDSPARLLGRIAFWALFLGAISLAVTALGIEALTDFVGAIFAYLPNVIAALLIFLVAGAIASGVAALVARTMGDTPTGKVVGSVGPVLIMAIGTFMVLDQLQIAPEIVTITYATLLGGVFLAMALAFGLGGRDVAGRMLAEAYDRGRENRDRFRRDVSVGADSAAASIPASDPPGQSGATRRF
jgi:hypothetical protein